MPVIPLVPSDSPTVISSLLRLSAHHLTLAASALQPLKSGTLSLHLSVPVPVLIPTVVTSRPTTASRPSNPRNPSPLAPQIRLLLTIVHLYKLYLLTYLLNLKCADVWVTNQLGDERLGNMPWRFGRHTIWQYRVAAWTRKGGYRRENFNETETHTGCFVSRRCQLYSYKSQI